MTILCIIELYGVIQILRKINENEINANKVGVKKYHKKKESLFEEKVSSFPICVLNGF